MKKKPVQYWLMKIEPSDVSIDDLAARPKQSVPWYGVRNYQARNMMRDDMQVGDLVWYYHSSCAEPGIAGLAKISSAPYPDSSQFDAKSKYHDPKSAADAPRWVMVDVQFVERWKLIPLKWLREQAALADLRLLARGNRLSIMPVDATHWHFVELHRELR